MKLEYILDRKGDRVETITPDVSVGVLVQRLRELNIGALVVSVDGRRVSGIVTERDVVRHLADDGPALLDKPVSAIMTGTVYCAPPEATTQDLMAWMTKSRFRHVPVLDGDDVMVGIVSIGDVVKSRVDELEYENTVLVEYITVGR